MNREFKITRIGRRKTLASFTSMLLIAALSFGAAQTFGAEKPPSKFLVVIDAGHQGRANMKPEPIGPGSKTMKPSVAGGTRGVVTHKTESSVNLAVALPLRKALLARGFRVKMIRTSQNVNIPNSTRAKTANNAHADLIIHLHCDAASKSTHGFLTIVPARNKWTGPILNSSTRAGRDIHAKTLASTHAHNRGISKRSDLTGFNWSKVPSVFVEMGLMTNAKEDRSLSSASYQTKLANGMAAGIARYASGK